LADGRHFTAHYIDRNTRPSVDAREIQKGLVIDVDENGQVAGIDIQRASQLRDLTTAETEALPLRS
jgi:uncharacterized protein YuzE